MPKLRILYDAVAPRRWWTTDRLFRRSRSANSPSDLKSIAGGHGSPLWRLLAMTYRSMLPHIAASRELAQADVGDVGTLADRLIAEAAAVRAQIVSKPQSCAWVSRP